jgi:hypothetical protein
MIELNQTQCSTKLAHLTVNTGSDDRDLIVKSKVLQVVDTTFEPLILGKDRSSLESGKDLSGMEAGDSQVTMPEYAATFIINSKGMRSIINDFQVVNVSDTLYRFHIARAAIAMHSQYGGRPRSNCGLDTIGVDVQTFRIDIYEHRRNTIPYQGMTGGHEGIGRSNDFTGDSQCLEGDDQCQGAVGTE